MVSKYNPDKLNKKQLDFIIKEFFIPALQDVKKEMAHKKYKIALEPFYLN